MTSPKIKQRLLDFSAKAKANLLPIKSPEKVIILEEVFGSTIEKICENEASKIPNFVQKCIKLIETKNCLDSTGIYRVDGNFNKIQEIKSQVNQGHLEFLNDITEFPDLTRAQSFTSLIADLCQDNKRVS